MSDELLAERIDRVKAEAERDELRRLVVEHHAVGVLDGWVIGEVCPVCARYPHLSGPGRLAEETS